MDRDSPENGPPFHFSLPPEYRHSNDFYLQDNLNGTATLTALRTFDRERQKEFLIPVVMSDSGHPAKTVTSTLTVTIGDQNDHAHVAGEKKIYINSHRGEISFLLKMVFFLYQIQFSANYQCLVMLLKVVAQQVVTISRGCNVAGKQELPVKPVKRGFLCLLSPVI